MGEEDQVFPISKFPPKIRVLSLNGSGLAFDFDSKAPVTLEELQLSLCAPLESEEVLKYFFSKNLRILRGFDALTLDMLKEMPNLEEMYDLDRLDEELLTLEALPRKLKFARLSSKMRPSHQLSLQNLFQKR